MSIAHVATNAAQMATPTSSTTISSTAVSVSAGQLIIMAFRWESVDDDTVTGTLTDNGSIPITWSSGHYRSAGNPEDSRIAVFWGMATVSESLTFTLTLGAARTVRWWACTQCSVGGAITVTDTADGGSGSNVSSWSLSSALDYAAGDFVYVAGTIFNSAGNPMTCTGFTTAFSSSRIHVFYNIPGSGGSVTPSGGFATADSFANIGMVFHEGEGGGGGGFKVGYARNSNGVIQ